MTFYRILAISNSFHAVIPMKHLTYLNQSKDNKHNSTKTSLFCVE